MSNRKALFICIYESLSNDYNFSLIKYLKERSIEVDYLNFDENTNLNYKEALISLGIRIINIRKNKIRQNKIRHLFNALKYIIVLIRYIVCKNYDYIIAVDYQLNILAFLLKKALFKKYRLVYIIQEMYQYSIKNQIIKQIVLSLDKKAQKDSLCILNRNELRKDYIDRINPSITKKHIVTYNGVYKYTTKYRSYHLRDNINIIYAGSIRFGLLDFLMKIAESFQVNKMRFKLNIYGLNDHELKEWSRIIIERYHEINRKINLNRKVTNENIIRILENTDLGIIYYPNDGFSSINELLSAPSKLFELIGQLVPIISYGSAFADKIIKEYKIGIVINKISDIKNIPNKIVEEYPVYIKNLNKMRENNIFVRDKEILKVASFLE